MLVEFTTEGEEEPSPLSSVAVGGLQIGRSERQATLNPTC